LWLDRFNAPEFTRITKFPFPSYSSKYNAADSALIEKICQFWSADIFLSTSYTSPLSTPSIAIVHDMIPEKFNVQVGASDLKEKEIWISHARRHICVSAQTKGDLLEFYPELAAEDIPVTYNVVDPEKIFPRPIAEQDALRSKLNLPRPYFIYAGSRTQSAGYNNARVFFESVASLNDIDFDILCLDGQAEIEPWIKGLDLKCRIEVANLGDDDLSAAYSSAVALIDPCLYGGIGLSVIEAWACGCPVIAARRDAGLDSPGDEAGWLDGHSPKKMKEALGRVREGACRERLTEIGHRHALRFRLTDFVDTLEGVAKDVVQRAGAGAYDDFYRRWTALRTLQGDVDAKR